MNGCMPGAETPKIAILMAVYEPRLDWLREQLLSLDGQTYPNIKLYIRDDCSPTVPIEAIQACVSESIRSFSWELWRNEKNLGSTGTFERLTAEAEGAYFAYCDQDDIWLPEKLSLLQKEIVRERAQLVCSDMYVIDRQGRRTADSITQVYKHFRFYSGEGLAEKLLIRNFVAGCTMLIRADTARAAVPFCPYMVHDHYLALKVAMCGKIASLPRPTISYRIHGENQTGSMQGITDKRSYYDKQILQHVKRLIWLQENIDGALNFAAVIDQAVIWTRARSDYFSGKWKSWWEIWKYRHFSVVTSLFELVFARMPEFIFMFLIRLRQKRIL